MVYERRKLKNIKIHAERILTTKKKLNNILAVLTNHSVKKIDKDTNRDYYMSPKEALEYGLIDKILEQRLIIS